MTTKQLDWMEIARTGWHAGKRPLTKDVFTSMLRRFSQQRDTDGVPVVAGHPEKDDPAYGWLTDLELRANDERGLDRGWSLWAKADVNDGFYQALTDKAYQNRSIGIRPLDDGQFEIRHLGFLGAIPPAIPGMQPMTLAADDDCQLYTFAASGEQRKGATDMAQENKSQTQPAPAAPTGDQATTTTSEANDFASQSELAQVRKELETERQARETERRARKLSEAHHFCERLVAEGRLTPAEATGMPELLAALPDDDGSALTFAEGGKDRKASPKAYLEGWLAGRPKRGDLFAETAKKLVGGKVGELEYSLDDRQSLHDAAMQYAADKDVTYTKALDAVVSMAKSNR